MRSVSNSNDERFRIAEFGLRIQLMAKSRVAAICPIPYAADFMSAVLTIHLTSRRNKKRTFPILELVRYRKLAHSELLLRCGTPRTEFQAQM